MSIINNFAAGMGQLRRMQQLWPYKWRQTAAIGFVLVGMSISIVIGWPAPVAAPIEAGLEHAKTFMESAFTSRNVPGTQQNATSQPPVIAVANIPAPATSFVTDQQALGIAAGSSLPSLDDQQLASRLDGIKASGARWIRLDFDWSLIQPKDSQTYDWAEYDRIVGAINARNIAILAILDYTPAWARQSSCSSTNKCAPASTSQFASFAAAAAHRYETKGLHYWEIWNEPNNLVFWQPAANPMQYTALLHDTYIALHTADLQAYVITAGLSPQATGNGSYAPYDFLAGMYAAGAHGYFDAVADHPYTFPLTPADNADDAWTQMARPNLSLRSLMVANGDGGKKIWITEFGAPTGGPGPVSTVSNPNLSANPFVVDEGRQALILTDAINLYHTYDWAGPFFYYTYQDAGTDPSTNENFFGLITAPGIQKQAYAVFQAAATKQ